MPSSFQWIQRIGKREAGVVDASQFKLAWRSNATSPKTFRAEPGIWAFLPDRRQWAKFG